MKLFHCLILGLLLLSFTHTSSKAQTKWFKYSGNPVLEKGSAGSWEEKYLLYQHVIWDGTEYKMWYMGYDGGKRSLGLATSADGIIWEKYVNNPVFEKGAAGEWDDDGIYYNYVLYDDSLYRMWYNGRNVKGIGLATSIDGINWEKYENNPVLDKGASGSWDDHAVHAPSVIYENSIYKMWYQGSVQNPEMDYYYTFRIGYAESSDGVTWVKRPEPILEEGDYSTWANDLMEPCVIYEANNYNMWYARSDIFTNDWHIDYATSPDGINFVKFENNPVLSHEILTAWDGRFVGGPTILVEDNLYKMWYTGDDGEDGSIGYAEDFSNLVHADSVMVQEIYNAPNQEPLNILGRIFSPDNHGLTAKALLLTDQGTLDSVDMHDDGLNNDGAAGDGIYGTYFPLTEEEYYTVAIKTVDQVTGFTRTGFNWGITDRFTSRGPIEFESIEITSDDPEPDAGTRPKFNITLHNFGNTDTVYNVDINIIIPDSLEENGLVKNTTTGIPKWGDIPPGESMTNSSRPYAISFHADCEDGLYSLGIEITSDDEPFWYDTFDITVDVEDELSAMPEEYSLSQNYPNPFSAKGGSASGGNPSTTIEYKLPAFQKSSEINQIASSIKHQVSVSLKVYDVLGREVATLVNTEQRPGSYQVNFDASSFTSGVYFYRITAGNFINVKKMLLIR